MNIEMKKRTGGWLNAGLHRLGLHLLKHGEFDRLASVDTDHARLCARLGLPRNGLLWRPNRSAGSVPPSEAAYLTHDNPRLRELHERYARVNSPLITRSKWTGAFVNRDVPLTMFRADGGYVYQLRQNVPAHYVVTAKYIRAIDRLGLLDRLGEDDAFGVYGVRLSDGRLVTRDLLDSIAEIYFLDRVLGISGLSDVRILDIGAGYGRFAHRVTAALPGVEKVFCVDAIPESTFLAEYYLRFRGATPRAVVVTLDTMEDTLSATKLDLAVNIHSFSECALETIAAWASVLAKLRVKHLMVVPNPATHGGHELLSRELDGRRLDFSAALRDAGYILKEKQPKYLDPDVQVHGISPTCHYLFEYRAG